MKNSCHKLFSLSIVLTLLFSSFGAIHVYADDAIPIPETTEEKPTEDATSAPPPEVQATEEPTAASEETQPAPTDVVITETTVEETQESPPKATEDGSDPIITPSKENSEPTDTEETADPTIEAEPTEEPSQEPTPLLSDEELDTLPEILKNVPDGTDVVVLDENGNVASMASESAANTMVEGDPIWCPDGQAPIPNTNGCTPSFASFSDLIMALAAGSYTGNGTIWVAHDYDATQDTTEIEFSGTALPNLADHTITLNGGWSGNAGDTTLDQSTPSILDDALSINYWNNTITLNNIFIDRPESDVGLYLETDGNIILNNVKVAGVSGSSTTTQDSDGDGAILESSGNITISDSSFENNDGIGLNVYSWGNITVDHVSVVNNNLVGAMLDSYAYGLGSGSVTVTGNSLFNGNGSLDNGPGLFIDSYTSTTISDVTASNNGELGILVYSGEGNIFGTANINQVTVSNNLYGIVLKQYADGDVTIANVESSSNGVGAEFYAMNGKMNISSSLFTNNLDEGLYVDTFGNIDISNTTISNNGNTGLFVYNQESLTLTNVIANNNATANVYIDATDPPKSCYCSCTSFSLNVNGGTYANSDVGIELHSYQSDQLILGTGANAPTFTNNATNVFQATTEIPECENCNCGCGANIEKAGKPFKIVDVPEGGSGNIPQECSIYAGTILKLADGSSVKIACPFTGFSSLKPVSESELPGALQNGETFNMGIRLGLLGEDGSYVINSDGTITLTFAIPSEKQEIQHRLLYWDTTINDGKGNWYELPDYHWRRNVPLHPDDPQDPRRIINGVRQSRNSISITINFSGYFLVVSEK